MRKEISALFAEQRLVIQMQQMRSVVERFGAGGAPPAARADEARIQDRPAPATVDPAIDAQQQAIACRSRRTGCTGAGGRGQGRPGRAAPADPSAGGAGASARQRL